MTTAEQTPTEQEEQQRERARPLPPEDRREAILWAVLPLIKEHGRDVSTKQLAEAAGVAEGTLFRAFGDKESLLEAAVAKLLDPLPLIAGLRSIDPDLPLERKLNDILFHLRARFTGVFRIMAALGMRGRPPVSPGTSSWIAVVTELLAPHADELAVPPETVAYWLRMQAFASTLPTFNTPYEFTTDELARLVTSGVAHCDGKDRL